MNHAVRQRFALFVSLAVLAAGAVTACDGLPGREGPRASDTAGAWHDPAAEPSLRPFYQQKLRWKRCGELQCATLNVPMDYRRPRDGQKFALPVVRHVAQDRSKRIGSLVYNPGGPGVSGVADLKSGTAGSLGKRVRDRFDVVSFDPRGVAGSKPAVDCTPADTEEPAAGTESETLYPRTAQERSAMLEVADSEAAACKARSGRILPHVGTPDVARDMDVLRAALGDRKLTYLGWSYGSSLGTTYGELFPRRVRAMVLDGAVDPSQDWYERAVGQGAAFLRSVDDYAEQCSEVVGEGCPGRTPQEISRLVDELYEETAAEPLPVEGSDDGLGVVALHTAFTEAMYMPEAQWEDLSAGLREAADGDGTTLARLAEGDEAGPEEAEQARKRGHRSASAARSNDNSDAAITAVNCLDIPHPRDPEAYWDALAPAYEAAGLHGTSGVVAELSCRNWPAGDTEPHRVRPVASGLPPVLVVGTTGDPSTPYEEARSLARQLPGGMLLTYEGIGHTAYGREVPCVDNAVDAYLTDRKRVAPGTTC